MDSTMLVAVTPAVAAMALVAWDGALDFLLEKDRRKRAMEGRMARQKPQKRRRVQLVDRDFLADLLTVTPSTVAWWGRVGKIPRLKFPGQTYRYDLDLVLEAMKVTREQLGLPPAELVEGEGDDGGEAGAA